MSLRISSFSLALILASCGSKGEDKVAAAAPDDRIECAIAGAAAFAKSCAVEKGEGMTLILRHEGGGFRRIGLAADGTISAADGSDEAQGMPLPDGRFELNLGSDRYRLPPRIR
jgi:hypothetical protein